MRNRNNLLVIVCAANSEMKQNISSQDVWTTCAFKNIPSSPKV